jgi:phosphoglycerol transferase MdoB-like AlkP superfamily enzyme
MGVKWLAPPGHSWAVLPFWLAAVIGFIVMLSLLRFALFYLNFASVGGSSSNSILDAFFMGFRFDLRMAIYGVLPIIFLPLIRYAAFVRFCRYWLLIFANVYLLLGLVELEFYREFQQRLNSLVFQYLREDPGTVIAMLWYGLPVLRYGAFFCVASYVLLRLINALFALSDQQASKVSLAWLFRVTLVFVLLLSSTIAARGTVRTGPPLRWGDAFVTDNMFLNNLALNGSYTLAKALMNQRSESDAHWLSGDSLQAAKQTRTLLHQANTQSTKSIERPIGRITGSHSQIRAVPKNVILVLMESFSAQYVGAMGSDRGVTPAFDALIKEGLLFERFFSNGTHTHQGMFATLSCFPNLPGHEYLMQQPEGRHQFSGIGKLLPDHQRLFVYNGDFSWDNQQGFFANQGFQKFVGRNDYIDPIHEDDVWGVSDEDMFDRALTEINQLDPNQPFVAVLQTLSNHLPYSLPEPLPIDPVLNADGGMDERLTAMKYADWALGKFVDELKQQDVYQDSLIVLVGDHGFGSDTQLTEVNLLRFHVPLLLLSTYLDDVKGHTVNRVGSQVDIVPTIMSTMGLESNHQCWGRSLVDLDPLDTGFAIVKPSGNEPTMAMIQGDNVVTYSSEVGSRLYQYQLGADASAKPLVNEDLESKMTQSIKDYVQTGLISLEQDRTSN